MYISWSPDGMQIAGGLPSYYMMDGRSPLWLWDVKTGSVKLTAEQMDNKQAVTWERGKDGIYSPKLITSHRTNTIAFSPDGQYKLIFDSYDPAGILRLYDTEIRQAVLTLEKGIGMWLCAAYSPDGRWIAVGNDNEIVIWNTQTLKIVRTIPVQTTALAFSPDTEYLAVANGWDIDLWKISDLVTP